MNFSKMYCYYCSYCCFLENMALQKAQFTRLHETELIVYFSCTFNGFFLSWTDAICLPKWLCENSYSHNCHIGMASFCHQLLVCVLRKTVRFLSFTNIISFMNCWYVSIKIPLCVNLTSQILQQMFFQVRFLCKARTHGFSSWRK